MNILTTFLMETFEMMPINSFSLYFSLGKKRQHFLSFEMILIKKIKIEPTIY